MSVKFCAPNLSSFYRNLRLKPIVFWLKHNFDLLCKHFCLFDCVCVKESERWCKHFHHLLFCHLRRDIWQQQKRQYARNNNNNIDNNGNSNNIDDRMKECEKCLFCLIFCSKSCKYYAPSSRPTTWLSMYDFMQPVWEGIPFIVCIFCGNLWKTILNFCPTQISISLFHSSSYLSTNFVLLLFTRLLLALLMLLLSWLLSRWMLLPSIFLTAI